MTFYSALQLEIINNMFNVYTPALNKMNFKIKAVNSFKKTLWNLGLYRVDFAISDIEKVLKELDGHMAGINDFYLALEEDKDKQLLVKLMANRILKGKVVLPLNNTQNFEQYKKTITLFDQTDPFISKAGRKFYKILLNSLGFDLQLYMPFGDIYEIFVLQQYRYVSNKTVIEVKKGDCVIDCGGCYGDTALYFSNAVGETGKIFSFEFIPSNIEIFKKNIALNLPKTANVVLENNPLWQFSGKKLFYKDWGPGSILTEQEDDKTDGFVETISIDDFVEKNSITKIDFIKMDIEGAEYAALNGALNTIRKHKPKLAIALYHSIEDFDRIPKLINSLNLGYKFHLAHFTANVHETMLFVS